MTKTLDSTFIPNAARRVLLQIGPNLRDARVQEPLPAVTTLLAVISSRGSSLDCSFASLEDLFECAYFELVDLLHPFRAHGHEHHHLEGAITCLDLGYELIVAGNQQISQPACGEKKYPSDSKRTFGR